MNHHPSKYGGGETDWRREVAVARLRALGDSLAASGWPLAVAVGDFNDTPDNPLFTRLLPAFSLCRMTEPATAHENRMERLSSEGDAAERAFTRNGSAPPARGTSRRELAASPSEDASQFQKGTLYDDLGNDLSSALSTKGKTSLKGQGSIRFNGEWQLIDLCFVSPALEDAAQNLPRTENEDAGLMARGILVDIGCMDIGDPYNLLPFEDGIIVVASSSDHTVLDITDCGKPLHVGDTVSFRLRYAGRRF